MNPRETDGEEAPAEFRETIGICAICEEWIHHDEPYLRRPDGSFCHRPCLGRGARQAPRQDAHAPG